MWTRTYLALLAVRLYLALQPSYIHPDENFQGPEVIAGMSPRRSNMLPLLPLLPLLLPTHTSLHRLPQPAVSFQLQNVVR